MNILQRIKRFSFRSHDVYRTAAKGTAAELRSQWVPAHFGHSRLLHNPWVKRRLHYCYGLFNKRWAKRWLRHNGNEAYFNFNGALLPDITDSKEKTNILRYVFAEVFLIPCCFNDNHSKPIAEYVDRHTAEGPYCYADGTFDVTVKAGDVVIDIGAWIGDFSAYAVSKGATAYAFEPSRDTFEVLCKTKKINKLMSGREIIPVQKGLGQEEGKIQLNICTENSGRNTILATVDGGAEEITITTLDKFVDDNGVQKVDFIKADIEGAERQMLRGARNVLRTFAPKLAICTYHLPDDPQVLEQIIMEANPRYKVVHLRHKLFAAVV